MKIATCIRVSMVGAALVLAGCEVAQEGVAPAAPQAAVEAPAPAPAPTTAPQIGRAASQTVTQIPPMTGRVVSSSVLWEDNEERNRPSELFFFGQALNSDGQTMICGVRTTTGFASRRVNGAVANGFRFLIGGQQVLRNMGFFKDAVTLDDIQNTPARCKVTTIPWQDSFEDAPWEIDYNGQRSFAL